MSVKGRCSAARSTTQDAWPWNIGAKVRTKSSRLISLTWSRRTVLPGWPATAGPKSLPTWWKTRLSTMAVMLPSVMPLPRMISAQLGTALATSGCAVT